MRKEHRIQTKNGWLFFCFGGDYYTWMIAFGKFCISWERGL